MIFSCFSHIYAFRTREYYLQVSPPRTVTFSKSTALGATFNHSCGDDGGAYGVIPSVFKLVDDYWVSLISLSSVGAPDVLSLDKVK